MRIRNDDYSSELKLAKKELSSICEIGNRLISTLDVKEILKSIVNTIPKLLDVSGCSVYIVDTEHSQLKLEAASSVNRKFKNDICLSPACEVISNSVLKNRTPISVSDLLVDKRFIYNNKGFKKNVRSLIATPIIFKGKVLGVIVALSKKPKYFEESEINLLSAYAAHTAIALNNAFLHKNVHVNYYNTISALVKTIEARDPYTCGHSERVTDLALKIAKKLNLSEYEKELLLFSSKLHDIGKIAIPDFILNKKTALTEIERAIIQEHPIKGTEMISNLKFLERCTPIISHHHERYDGKGYPDGLKGNKIPLLARIVSLADAFDAMTSERPYRRRLKINEAVEEIKYNSNAQFDPKLAEIFVSIILESGLHVFNDSIFQPISLAS